MLTLQGFCVLSDCDGVAVNSEMIAHQALVEVYTAIDCPITLEDIREKYLGLTHEEFAERASERFGVEIPDGFPEERDATVLQALRENVQATGGFYALMEQIPNKALVSNGSLEQITVNMQASRLDTFFHTPGENVFSAEMVENPKPAPDVYLLAAEKMGFSPEKCVVIEDSIGGIKAGVAAGMTVIGYTGGDHILEKKAHGEKMLAAGATAVIVDMDDFLLTLEQILENPSADYQLNQRASTSEVLILSP